MKSKCLLVITGPTAAGKTDLSVDIAQTLDAEILSADARQFYRELHIGTASPSKDNLDAVKHHFVGHLSVSDYYNVAMFEKQALQLLTELFRKSDFALLVGGSGLYIDTVCYGIDELPDPDPAIRKKVHQLYAKEGLPGLRQLLHRVDPDYHSRVDTANHQRIMRALEVCLATGKSFTELRTNNQKQRPFSVKKVVLDLPRNELFARINTRANDMIAEGLIEECLGLYRMRHFNALNTVGYKELFDWLANKWSLKTAIEKIKTSTRRYAKRQMTWFKRYDDAAVFHPSEKEAIIDYARQK
jgi:tRNA dimethylallyltransferase